MNGMAVNIEAVPAALRERNQWVCWKYVTRDGKETKMPVCAHNLKAASSTDPSTWADFDTARQAYEANGLSGVGFVFSPDDPFYGVDLDDCIDYFGKPAEAAQAIIDTLGTYCEVSPSGAGVKLIGIGAIPAECNRNRTKDVQGFGEIEVYDRGRFFTITGNRLGGTPDEPADSHGAFAGLCRDFLVNPEAKPARQPAKAVEGDDGELLTMIRSSAQGPKFSRLWSGDTSDYGGDDSAADMALSVILAWWTQRNEMQMDRLFRQSALLRDKWDARRGDSTYGKITLHRAIELCPDCYQPSEAVDWDTVLKQAAKQVGALERFLQDTIQGKRRPIKWPWATLHRCTRALIPQTLTVLCGSPGASKSFLLLQCLGWWHEQGVPVRALMLEDSVAYHMRRAMAQRCHTSELTDDEWIEDNPDVALEHHSQHRAYFESLERCIHEPPKDAMADVPLICGWLEHEAKAGDRVLAVDPITLADAGEKQFVGDRQLISRAKQIAELYGVSIILVTHPKNDAARPYLDGVAGGKTITRAAQTVVWLEYLSEPKSVVVKSEHMMGLRQSTEVNRIIHVLKSRNAVGQGRSIGMNFKKDSLTFSEAGLIVGAGEE